MMNRILGRKIGMTQIFASDGELIPVTVVQAEKNIITQIKTDETDGYNAIQLGVEDKREKVSNKPEIGHVKKANTNPKRFVKELRIESSDVANYQVGQVVAVDTFEAGDFVDIQGVTKGKGFQGVIKRHGHSRGPMSHGSRHHRRPGSLGAVAPSVFKGKKLPGQMGANTVTVQNLEVIMINTEENLILVKGNIPGPKKSFVTITTSLKKQEQKAKTRNLVDLEVNSAEDTVVE